MSACSLHLQRWMMGHPKQMVFLSFAAAHLPANSDVRQTKDSALPTPDRRRYERNSIRRQTDERSTCSDVRQTKDPIVLTSAKERLLQVPTPEPDRRKIRKIRGPTPDRRKISARHLPREPETKAKATSTNNR